MKKDFAIWIAVAALIATPVWGPTLLHWLAPTGTFFAAAPTTVAVPHDQYVMTVGDYYDRLPIGMDKGSVVGFMMASGLTFKELTSNGDATVWQWMGKDGALVLMFQHDRLTNKAQSGR